MTKRSRRKNKNKKRRRRLTQLPPTNPGLKTQENIVQVKADETMVPLTYPPHLLKTDLFKTLIITAIIILAQAALYWYDRQHGLSHLGQVLSSFKLF